LLGSVVELARLTDTPVPTLEAVDALKTLLGRPLQAGALTEFSWIRERRLFRELIGIHGSSRSRMVPWL
jgi:hypothetical protein